MVLFTTSYTPLGGLATESNLSIRTSSTWDSEDDDDKSSANPKSRSREVSKLSVIHARPHEQPLYDVDSRQNAFEANSNLAKVALEMMEKCTDNALSKEGIDMLTHKLIKQKDVATVAMLSARAQKLTKTAFITIDPRIDATFRRAYSEQLHRAGRFVARCSLDKLARPDHTIVNLDVEWLYSPKLRCSLCRLSVRSAITICNRCEHGGHTPCLSRWFDSEDQCPAGCGCRCAS
jgi:Zinc-ribbon, C4HC2 type